MTKAAFNLGLWFQRIRVHDVRARTWQQDDLRAHTLIHKQEAEKTNSKWHGSFEI